MKKASLDVRSLLKETNQTLHRYLAKKKPRTLYEPPQYLLAGGGKRLRAILVLLCCGLVGEQYRKALDAAAAVEILHNFSLIHDDIMDNDDWRRGRPTIHKKWDANVAILAGDGLAAIAFQALSRCPKATMPRVVAVFSDGFLQLCEGQALDKEFETRTHVTEGEYRTMIAQKTSVLFRVSALMGAIIGGATARQEKALAAFGTNLGLAFQIQDDLLDVTGDEAELGKSTGSDLIEQKKTYISILASKVAGGPEWLAQFGAALDPAEHRRRLTAFTGFLRDHGIIQKTERLVDRYLREAMRHLGAFPSGPAKSELLALTQRLWKRRS